MVLSDGRIEFREKVEAKSISLGLAMIKSGQDGYRVHSQWRHCELMHTKW